MSAKKSFTPRFVYKKDEQIKGLTEHYGLTVELLNNAVKEGEKLLERTLEDNEKMKLSKGHYEFVLEEVKSKYPFPKADDAFNLNALGLDPEVFVKAIKHFKRSVQGSHIFTLKDGVFVITQETINLIENEGTVYTVNEKQNKALEIGRKFEGLFTEAEKEGFLSKFSMKEITKIIPFMQNEQNAKAKSGCRIVFKPHFIMNLYK